MKLEVGKYYRTRGGDKVGPLREKPSRHFPFTDGEMSWTQSGCYFAFADGTRTDSDLVAEWVEDNPPCEAQELADEPILDAAHLPDSNPKTRVGITKPTMRGIPSAALLHLGGAMADGVQKYGIFNWREHAVAASVYEDAIWRHLVAWRDGENTAADSGQHHLAHVMACCAIILDALENGKLLDDRGPAGVASEMIARHVKNHR